MQAPGEQSTGLRRIEYQPHNLNHHGLAPNIRPHPRRRGNLHHPGQKCFRRKTGRRDIWAGRLNKVIYITSRYYFSRHLGTIQYGSVNIGTHPIIAVTTHL